jgi:hypothetical protein
MLSKGDKKMSISDHHFKKVNAECSTKGWIPCTCVNSDDATTWAQRFVMPVFGAVLSRIFSADLLEPMCAILNLVTLKKLELPHQLLELFIKHDEIRGFDDGMNELKDQFFGLSDDKDLLETGSRMLKNRSNMMQGILHFTSSLLHAGYMLSWRKYTILCHKEIMKRTFPMLENNFKLIITTKVSSDDSSSLITMIYDENYTDRKFGGVLTLCSEVKTKMYNLFCAEHSEQKSTKTCLSNIEEFNSIWHYKNTILLPVIKFISAAIKTKIVSCFDQRYHIFSNLRSQLFEMSGNAMLTHMISICQATAHYRTLGMSTSIHWRKFMQKVIEKPHPAFGFYLYEHPMTAGLLGHNFSIFCACSSSLFRRIHLSFKQGGKVEFAQSGNMTIKTYLSFGQNVKHKQLLSELGVNKLSLKKSIDDDPCSFFNRPNSHEVAILNMKLTACGSEVAESLSQQTDSQLHSTAAYVLQDNVVMISKGYLSEESDFRSLVTHLDSVVLSEDEDVDWMFPFCSYYKTVLKLLKDYSKCNLGGKITRRSVFCKLPLYQSFLTRNCTLMDVCRKKWFNILDVRGSKTEHDIVFEHFREKFPWLSDTYELTIEKMPLHDAASLRNFINSQSVQHRTVNVFCPAERSSSVIETLNQIISNTQWKSHKLYSKKTPIVESDVQLMMKDVAVMLWRLSKAPETFGQDVIRERAHSLLSELPDPMEKFDMTKTLLKMNRTELGLCILVHFVNTVVNKNNKEESADENKSGTMSLSRRKKREEEVPSSKSTFQERVLNYVRHYKIGTVGSFHKEQIFNPDTKKWTGLGIYRAEFGGKKAEVTINDDRVISVSCESYSDLRTVSDPLLSYMKQQGWIGESFKVEIKKDGSKVSMSTDAKYWNLKKKRWAVRWSPDVVEVQLSNLLWEVDVITDDLELIISKTGVFKLVTVNTSKSFISIAMNVKDMANTGIEYKYECKDALDAWIYGRTASLDDLLKWFPDDKHKTWCQETLLKRLIIKGVDISAEEQRIFDQRYTKIKDESSLAEVSTDSDDLEDLLDIEFDMDEYQKYVKMSDSEESDNSSMDEMEKLLDDIDEMPLLHFGGSEFEEVDNNSFNMIKAPSVMRITRDYAITSRFWDELIRLASLYKRKIVDIIKGDRLSITLFIERLRIALTAFDDL